MSRYKFPETHGLWNKYRKEYQCWQDMLQRCKNINNKNYKNYGGRGIFVCDEWENNFEQFLNDMGEKPENMSLDRIDNNKEYSKSNCKWSTNVEQMRNTRRSKSETAGVHYCKRDDAWIAQIGLDGKIKHVGFFKNKDDAINARKEAESIYWKAHGIGNKIQKQERNFCERCGKRLSKDADHIHTCTPPRD